MGVGLLLVDCLGGFVYQPQFMRLITDEQSFEEGEDFEIGDDFVDGEIADFEGSLIPIDSEHGDGLLIVAAEVEHVLFFAILDLVDDLVVGVFGNLHLG